MKKFDNWTLYEKTEYTLLKELDFNGCSKKGYVYILEYGDKLKIGTTKEPWQRLKSLKFMGNNYSNVCTGAILVSKAHYNRFENEKILHGIFSDSRYGDGELFSENFDKAIEKILKIDLEFVLDNKRPKRSTKDIIRLLRGDRNNLPHSKDNKPMFICFSDRVEFIMFSIGIFSKDEKEKLFSEIENYINQFCDYQSYKNGYERETERSESNIIDVCEYFPELGRLADDYLDRVEKFQSKQ